MADNNVILVTGSYDHTLVFWDVSTNITIIIHVIIFLKALTGTSKYEIVYPEN